MWVPRGTASWQLPHRFVHGRDMAVLPSCGQYRCPAMSAQNWLHVSYMRSDGFECSLA